MNNAITIHKLDHQGNPIWQYTGKVLTRDLNTIQLEAFFNRDDYTAAYHIFRRGDRFIEYFYADRWYNIFQMYDGDNGRLKGWYCNITRPARFEQNAIYAEDLALDLMVYPDGHNIVLDEEEFANLDIDSATEKNALRALDTLKSLVERGEGVFNYSG